MLVEGPLRGPRPLDDVGDLRLPLGGEGPTAIAAELVVFALTPYLGLREAQRWAAAVTDGAG
jgi:hypothetical protein